MAVVLRLSMVLLAATAAGAAAQRAPAVRAGAQLGASVEHAEGDWRAGPRAALDLRLDRSWLSAASTLVLAGGGAADWQGRASTTATLASPSIAGWRVSIDGEHASSDATAGSHAASRAEARVARSGTRWGLWAFGDVARADARTVAARDSAVGARARVASAQGLGAWRQFRNVMVSARLSSHSAPVGGRPATLADSLVEHRIESDTGTHVWYEHVTRGDSGSAASRARWAETELRLSWAGERALFDAAVGARPAMGGFQRRAAWAELAGAVQLRRALWIAGAVGLTPERPDLGITHRRFARVGLQLSPHLLVRRPRAPEPRAAPSAFALTGHGDGAYLVTLRLPPARTVEISGDFSGWRPVALSQVAPGRWETVVRLAPGTHRISVRVDGDRWTAPPGATSVEDDYGGTAGIIIAR